MQIEIEIHDSGSKAVLALSVLREVHDAENDISDVAESTRSIAHCVMPPPVPCYGGAKGSSNEEITGGHRGSCYQSSVLANSGE